MVYDVQDINSQLEKYLRLNKQLQYLENHVDDDNVMQIENLRHELILTETKINLIKPNFENPEKMKYQFSGCAFVTFKTQKMISYVKQYSKKKFFFQNLDKNGSLIKPKSDSLKFIMRNAPEPTDVIWENFEKNHSRWKWIIISILVSLVANLCFIFLIRHIKSFHTKSLSKNSNMTLADFGIS